MLIKTGDTLSYMEMFENCMVLLLVPIVVAFDPCSNYKLIRSAEYRGDKCMLYEISNAVCDRSIDNGWYAAKHNGHFLEMPMTCPSQYACGTDFPVWLNGTHPSFSDGIVTRRLCMRSASNCCMKSVSTHVRNCGTFFVYNLTYTDICNYAYCFGNNTCPPAPSTTVIPKTEKTPLSKTNWTGIIAGIAGIALLFSILAIILAAYRIHLRRKSRITSQVMGISEKHLPPHQAAHTMSATPTSPPPPYRQ